jgi:trimethylamine--corrinoid protein Co-methyltransferase
MHLTAQILTEEEQHRIHNMSLRILAEVGIRFHGDRAPRILRENGVNINQEDKIAKIPSELVEQALKTAPKSFVLGARNPINNFPLPADMD